MKHVKALFELDTRSLALFRILLGLTLVSDLLFRAAEIPTFYTDNGVLPRAPLITYFLNPFYFSLHLASGSVAGQSALFALAIICALAFLFGYRTRLATFLSWLLLVSLHNRNFMVLSGSDQLMRMLLFWSMFLPTGAVYSVDRALSDAESESARTTDASAPYSFVSMGSAAFILQICFVYLFSAVLKSDPAWWNEGSALYYALSIDDVTTRWAKLLLQFPNALWVLSWFSIFLEAVAPMLLFVPRVQERLRTLIVFTFILFHAGMLPFLTLGTFPFVSIAAWSALLPARFWERLHARARSERTPETVIYYDGDCGFCRRMAYLIRTFLALGDVAIKRAQDAAEIDVEMRRLNSWIVVSGEHAEERLSKFDAFVYLCRLSPIARPLAPVLATKPARWLGARVYGWVARHRGLLGKLTGRLRPSRPVWKPSGLNHALAACLIVYVLAWNLGTITGGRVSIPAPAQWISALLRLDQRWGMFAPYPRKADGWLVIPALLADGTQVDLFRDGAPIQWAKPAQVSALFPNAYRQKFMENLLDPQLSGTVPLYAQHLCRAWNAEHSGGQTLNTFEITYMEETTPPPNAPTPAPRRITFWKQSCFP